jgi:RHS repeat-associated protein
LRLLTTASLEGTPAGALASVATPAATVDYTVDGRGLRQSRTVGLATEDLVWSTAGALPLLLEDGDHAYLYGPSLAPIAQVDGIGGVEYLHGDLLGSVRAITDGTGAVVGASAFDAFGSRTAHTGTADSLFGFTGNWTDPDTGLVHLRARDYDPGTGQFLSVDPAVDATRQPYAYTGNNPLLLTDPSGLCPRYGGANVPDCTWLDFYFDVMMDYFLDNLFAVWAGASDGVGFNVPMLMDDSLYCKYKDHPGYWAGDVIGVIVGAATLGSGALARIGTASLARTASAEAPAVAGVGTTIDRTAIGSTISRQKQAEHTLSSNTYTGGGYFRSASEAQIVLDEFRNGTAIFLGTKANGDIVVRSPTVIGYNVNIGSGFASQQTDVFFIKGTNSPVVVPYNPNWKP